MFTDLDTTFLRGEIDSKRKIAKETIEKFVLNKNPFSYEEQEIK